MNSNMRIALDLDDTLIEIDEFLLNLDITKTKIMN